MIHRSTRMKTVLLGLVFASVAAGLVVANGRATVQQASAYPSRARDCTICHGAAGQGVYTNHVTAVPSTNSPAPGAAYTVTITMDPSTDGAQTGYWIANSDAAGTTGTTTGVYAYSGPSPQAMTAPVAPGTYHYKVFGQSGLTAPGGSTGFAIYSITVGAAATPTPTNTAVPPTATSTNTPVPPTPTNTPVPPTATSTNTPVPPTATSTSTAVPPTNTAVPPTATNTPAPPTATSTSTAVPPTNTAVPPTATNTPASTATATPPAANTATNTPVPPTATMTPPPANTPTATNTAAPTSTPTTTLPVTNTPTATATSTPGQCLEVEQRLELASRIMRRLGSHAGDRRYDVKFDVNGDGVIDGLDLVQVVTTPACTDGDDDDGDHDDDDDA